MVDRSEVPVIVTGCGRSGTHWLGNIMEAVFGEKRAKFEPTRTVHPDLFRSGTVIVDSRLRHGARDMERDGYEIVHLTRDGRDVVRSLWQWYNGGRWESDKMPEFDKVCDEWADAVRMLSGYRVIRIEDLNSVAAKDASLSHWLPHWTEWPPELRERFWERCGHEMLRLEYTP